MNLETTLPWSWLKSVPSILKSQDAIPLFGSLKDFPLEAFAKEFGKIIEIPDLELEIESTEWHTTETLFKGLGKDPLITTFTAAPLDSIAQLILPKLSLENLMTSAYKEPISLEWQKQWSSDWKEEFYQFLILQAIQVFSDIKFDPDLSIQMLPENETLESSWLCFDIKFKFQEKVIIGRLAISSEMLNSFRKKHTKKTLSYSPGMSQTVTTFLQVSIGNTLLRLDEWKQIIPGDLLILDNCTYTPDKEDKGRAILSINNTPIFRAKFKDKGLKLLEFPLLQEVNTPMAKYEDDEFDETFDTEEEPSESEHEEDHTEETHEDFTFEELTEEHTETEDFSFQEHEEDEKKSASEEEKPIEAKKSPLAAHALLNSNASLPLIKPEEIPLSISIEVARIQMSIDQLLQLKAGNLLDLQVSADDGVDLVVNGKCIGKGELLKIGETLGVRILDKA